MISTGSQVWQKSSDMSHSEHLSRRGVLQDQARLCTSKFEGDACLTLFVVSLAAQHMTVRQVVQSSFHCTMHWHRDTSTMLVPAWPFT